MSVPPHINYSAMTVKESLVKKHKHFNVEHFQIPELLSSGIQQYKQSQIIATFCLWQQNSQGCLFFFYSSSAQIHSAWGGLFCMWERTRKSLSSSHFFFCFWNPVLLSRYIVLDFKFLFCICGYIMMKLFESSFGGSLRFKRQGLNFKYCVSTNQISLTQNQNRY